MGKKRRGATRRSDIPEERYVCKKGENILVDEEGVWIMKRKGE